MSSTTKNAISKSSAKITSFLRKAPASADDSSTSRDESTALETENSNVFDDTSCSLQTVHHEDGGMSTPTDTGSKKRVASQSPTVEAGIMLKKPALLSLDDSLAELLSHDPSFEKDTPHWVPLLFTSFAAVVNELKVVSSKLDAAESFKKEMSDKVVCLNSTVDSMKSDFECLKAEMKIMKAENTEMKNNIGLLIAQVDHNEQHSRNECLLLHGVPEKSDRSVPENSKVIFAAEISSKVGVKMTEKNIKRAHRYGPPAETANRVRSSPVSGTRASATLFTTRKKS